VKDRVDVGPDVVRKVIDTVQPLAERKGLTIREEVPQDLPWVLADSVRLRQALLNLLTNAIRFTERGGITVTVRACEHHLEISVADTGRGIAAEDMPRLFQEFRPLQPTATREGAGSGLGLSISKHLIELHGGRIWAESQEGQGTTLTFSVPLPDVEVVAMDGLRRVAATLPSGVHDICLVVHNDPYVVRLLARHVDGFTMVGVPEAGRVLRLVEELHPRAVVAHCDVAPTIEASLARTPYDVPVIGCGLPRVSEVPELAGVRGYLVKPVSQEMVRAMMGQEERNGHVRVLLVDDDPDAVRLLERMLTALPHRYSIYKAYDGLDALEIAQEVVPHIAFVDLVMPGLTGSELVAKLRELPPTRDTAIVIVSAQDWAEQEATFDPPLYVAFRRGVGMAEGASYLKSLLEVLSPRYLGGEALAGSPSPTPRG
jgi:CheY-like chemotaxis protein/anti-sigma regulatory factor (Ser/Thr protein kinase)